MKSLGFKSTSSYPAKQSAPPNRHRPGFSRDRSSGPLLWNAEGRDMNEGQSNTDLRRAILNPL